MNEEELREETEVEENNDVDLEDDIYEYDEEIKHLELDLGVLFAFRDIHRGLNYLEKSFSEDEHYSELLEMVHTAQYIAEPFRFRYYHARREFLYDEALKKKDIEDN